jgi:glutathione S-transferase
MYRLYYDVDVASLAPHFLLHEAGAPYELVLVDREKGAQHDPGYLRLNPHARIPTLVDGDLVLWESAAICLHLCDRHPETGLAPPLGSNERSHFYKWLVYLTNTLQAAFMIYYYPQRAAESEAARAEVKRVMAPRIAAMLRTIDREIGDGPYLLGAAPSAADHYLLMLAGWSKPDIVDVMTLPALARLIRAMVARPAVAATYAAEGIAPPFSGMS